MLPIPTTYFISIKKEIVYISVGAEMYIHETSRYPMVFPTNFSEIPINRLTNSNVDRQNIESLEKGISKLLNLE